VIFRYITPIVKVGLTACIVPKYPYECMMENSTELNFRAFCLIRGFFWSLFAVYCRPIARGVVSGHTATLTNLDFPTTNSQNITDRHKNHATPYCIHVLPLLNHHVWKQLLLKNVYICKMLCAVLIGCIM